tara:strand:+ start:12280 stop:13164 length:885 start_codon:yes stop_codon:yes gene_type:complete
MNLVLSIHIFPNELGKYQRLVERINATHSYIESRTNTISTHVVLNLNDSLIDWNNSPIKKEEVISTYTDINNILTTDDNVCTYINNPNFIGVNEHRRNTIKNYTDVDSIIFLDADVHFRDKILKHHIDAYSLIDTDTMFIITPQTVRLWDDTWDCIVNDRYIKKSHNFHKKIIPNEVLSHEHGDVTLVPTDSFKWGGGWFNSISPKLLSLVGIPESFVGYGPDDTYVMQCAYLLKNRGYKIQQYILQNELIVEEPTKPTECPYSKIPMKENSTSFRTKSERIFGAEIKNFLSKL